MKANGLALKALKGNGCALVDSDILCEGEFGRFVGQHQGRFVQSP
jgi:hypothetical protein